MSMIRKTLAHYEITSQLGKGVVGEETVFRLFYPQNVNEMKCGSMRP
jgi:hypothetical protein